MAKCKALTGLAVEGLKWSITYSVDSKLHSLIQSNKSTTINVDTAAKDLQYWRLYSQTAHGLWSSADLKMPIHAQFG